LDKGVDRLSAVQQGKIRMVVEVDEIGHGVSAAVDR
jgi:hypothetical protein